jgi:hypothetical protein
VGIGLTTPSQRLDVNGNINIPTSSSTAGALYQNGVRLLHTYGTNNTFVGVGAGNFTTTGQSNVAVGTNALSSLGVSANFNFGLGNGAGSGITTGQSNILIGNSVGTGITTQSHNTIIGDAAGFSSTGLSGVVYIGRGAGRAINTFTDSVFLGTVAGGTTDGGLQTVKGLTNAIAIGARSYVGASHTMVLGSVGAYAVDIASGTSTASAKLHLIKTAEQLRLGYDVSNYLSTTVGSSGLTTFNAVGTSPAFSFTGGNVGIGTTSPLSKLSVDGDVTITGNTTLSTSTLRSAILAVDQNGMIIATSTSAGGVSAVTGTYPVVSSGGATPVISLAFGTTTSNTWAGTQTFGNASTTNITIGTAGYITGLSSAFLAVDGNGQIIATTSPLLAFTESDPYYAVASSTILRFGTTTDALTEGATNKFWSNTLFDTRLNATTSLKNLGTLAGLASIGSSTGQTTILGKTVITNASTTDVTVSGLASTTNLVVSNTLTAAGTLSVTSTSTLSGNTIIGGKMTSYNGMETAGEGIPHIVAVGKVIGGTGPTTVLTYTAPAEDGLYILHTNSEGSATTTTFQLTFTVDTPMFSDVVWSGTLHSPPNWINSYQPVVLIEGDSTATLRVTTPTSGGTINYNVYAALTRIY